MPKGALKGTITNDHGSILLIVLCLLSVMLLLITLSLTRVTMSQKMTSFWDNKLYTEIIAKRSLVILAEKSYSFETIHCRIEPVNPSKLESISYWRQLPYCQLQGNYWNGYYIVEDLGEYPCGIINDRQHAHFWRISVWIQTRDNINSIMQNTLARAEEKKTSCAPTEERVAIHSGQQSWRIFV